MQRARSSGWTPDAQPSPISSPMDRPLKSSQAWLKKVQSLSVPDTQIITAGLSAIRRKRPSLSMAARQASALSTTNSRFARSSLTKAATARKMTKTKTADRRNVRKTADSPGRKSSQRPITGTATTASTASSEEHQLITGDDETELDWGGSSSRARNGTNAIQQTEVIFPMA